MPHDDERVRLVLTWPGKDKFLLLPKDENGRPVRVERDHPAASEVRLTDFVASCRDVDETNSFDTAASGGEDVGSLTARHREVITSQTKTRQRVRDLAEVYTNEREVNAMLDLVPDMFPSVDSPRDIGSTFLEPACGAGNFLVAILERKLAFVKFGRIYRSIDTFEAAVLKALSSVYGIDIDPQNVNDSRHFLRVEIEHHVNMHLNSQPVTSGFFPAVDVILTTNVIRSDALKDASQIELVEYHWQRKAGYVVREWSRLEDEPGKQLDLFAEPSDGPSRDAVAIHYSLLADHADPVVAKTGMGRNR